LDYILVHLLTNSSEAGSLKILGQSKLSQSSVTTFSQTVKRSSLELWRSSDWVMTDLKILKNRPLVTLLGANSVNNIDPHKAGRATGFSLINFCLNFFSARWRELSALSSLTVLSGQRTPLEVRWQCYKTRGRCFDHNFLRFLPIFCKKWRFSQKSMLWSFIC
jgi:hypothetical protein